MPEIWAKKPKDGKVITLKQHTKDLLDDLEKLREKLPEKLGNIEKNTLFDLLKYAVFFHDLGKVSPSFQKNLENTNYYEELKELLDIDIRHNILSLFFINKNKVEEICKNDESLFCTLLSSVAFHHWRKDEKEYLLHINDELKKACEKLLENKNGEKLASILKEHFKGFNKINAEDLISFNIDLAEHIKEDGDLISYGIIPPYTLYFLPERLRAEAEQKINLNLWIFLSGFLMRLDHFVSFCECEGLDFEAEKEIPKTDLRAKLEEKFGENFWQKEFLNLKDKNIILIAPTGIGKTEFAFLWSEGEKFFYTLPLRVATNQIFDRACGYFNENKSENKDLFIEGNVGLLHSDADLFIIDKWETAKNTEWDGEIPKIIEISRHLSLPVNISTGDQIFPSALKYPGYEKIYATLGYSKLIIDEVQAYDPRASAIVVKMIKDIVSLGGKFLLMTATLPGFIKDIIKEELENKYVEIDLYEGKIRNEGKERDTIKIKDIARHKIELKEKDIEDDVDEIIKKANIGKRILVVLNTVEKAESIYEKIKDSGKFKGFLELLHSRFTLNERKEKEKKLEEEFKNPKPENENLPKILVATQVVEASLDIDADYLFTEIAPIDSLIQRMGRVVRRVDLLSGKVKGKDEDFEYGNLYEEGEANILVYCEKEKDKIKESGKGKVYETELIQKAYRVLKNKKEIKESEKQGLVNEFYENVKNEKSSEYLQKFYKTLRVVNSGYVSENKEEAQNIFREIYTVPIVDKNKVDEIADKIVNKIKDDQNITWLWFKKEIIAEFVINENMRGYKEYELESLWNKIKDKIEIKDENKSKNLKKGLENYCSGIYVIEQKEQKVSIIE